MARLQRFAPITCEEVCCREHMVSAIFQRGETQGDSRSLRWLPLKKHRMIDAYGEANNQSAFILHYNFRRLAWAKQGGQALPGAGDWPWRAGGALA